VNIKEFIEQLLPQGTPVTQASSGDRGAAGLQGMAGELANVQQVRKGGALNRTLARHGEKLAKKGAATNVQVLDDEPASVTAYGSGNAAQVYFDLAPRKLKLSELEAAYPGMVDALVQHPGLGMVIGYADDMTAVVLGKDGRRNLHTGVVEGNDPVAAYAPAAGPGAATVEKRVRQLRRVMDFPSAGDLWLISTVYADGTVAALEELVGNHGGVGGEQTDAFLFHPADVVVPETQNATDVFHILNSQRNAPLIAEDTSLTPAKVTDWAPRTLVAGLGRVRIWTRNALGCLILDRRAYQRVARDPYMTGPALLIILLGVAGGSIAHYDEINALSIAAYLVLWLLMTAVLFAAGYLLTKRGSFTRTFRTLGFARVVTILEVLSLYPPIEAAVHVIVFVVSLLAIWMAAATAHQLKGWRTAVLPLAALAVFVLGAMLVNSLVHGAEYSLLALLNELGITPR
jgi:hypothetical protein